MRLSVPIFAAGVLLALPVQAQVARPGESISGVYCPDHTADAAAQEDQCTHIDGIRWLEDDRITVLATGLWTRLDDSGQAISVLKEADLRAVQGPDIARALQRLPGVTLTRNGGLGSFTGLSVRGAGSQQVLVLVDGARLNDVAGPAGGFDFGSMVTGSLERVELLRGSNSLIWGSDALGGVIHLTTRQVNGLEASAETGSQGQFAATVAGGIGQGMDHHLGLAASYVKRGGFSAAAGGSEADGFKQLALSARGDMALAPYWRVFGNARYADSRSDIDGFPPPDYVFADTLERQDMRQLSARAGVEYSDGDSLAALTLAHAYTDRDLIDRALGAEPYYSTSGASTRAEAHARTGVANGLELVTGADWEWSNFADGLTSASTNVGSVHAMLELSPETGPWDRQARLTAGLRYDHHRNFGSAWNLAANGKVNLTPTLRLRASWGQGFKAPSLYQLHSDYGNLQLSPERSNSVDLGADFHSPDLAFAASLTLFRRDSRNLIDFVSCAGLATAICTGRPYGTYDNVGRARAQGLELAGSVQLASSLQMSAVYSWIESTNRATGLALARHPQNAATLTADWGLFQQKLLLGADLRLVSGSFDDAANSVRLGGYALGDLRARWVFSQRFELFGRIENLWDENYQTAAGYAAQGRAGHVGARVKL